ncbi:MAG: trypsin-like serine protease, partial [Planctomycetota bacterium]
MADQAQYAPTGELLSFADNRVFGCSATLIAPGWVLTAAHCVDGFSNGDPDPIAFSIFVDRNGDQHNVAETILHPDWVPEGEFSGSDFALLRLDTPLEGIQPAVRYGGDQEGGATATLVGYGRSGTGITGDIIDAGTRRAGQNVIDLSVPNPSTVSGTISADSVLLATDFDSPDRSVNIGGTSNEPLPLEYQGAGGDSGGSWYIEDAGTTWLAGVHSASANATAGPGPRGRYGYISAIGRVSLFNDWINDTVGGIHWRGLSGDSANDGVSWAVGALPTSSEKAIFASPAATTVQFDGIDQSYGSIEVDHGVFTFANAANVSTSESIVVGTTSRSTLSLNSPGTVLSAGSDLVVGQDAGSDGRLRIDAGVAVRSSSATTIGDLPFSRGIFEMLGGELRVHPDGFGDAGDGPDFNVGREGDGTVLQSNGTIDVGDALVVGRETTGDGTFLVFGGETTVDGNTEIGFRGSGELRLADTGGFNALSDLTAGQFAGSEGEVFVEDSAQIGVDGTTYIGRSGRGELALRGNADFIARGEFRAGEQADGTGSVAVTGGNLIVGSTGSPANLEIGIEGLGQLDQSAGRIVASQQMVLGADSTDADDAPGVYGGDALLRGTAIADIATDMVVGAAGSGRLRVAGLASLSLGNDLQVGTVSGGEGTIELTGGEIAIDRQFNIGRAVGGSGTVTMSGGQVTIGTDPTATDRNLLVGSLGTGALTQTGGSIGVDQDVYVGGFVSGENASEGQLTLSGSSTLSVGRDARVGNQGTGLLTVGGSAELSIHDDLDVGVNSSGDGTVRVTGGVLRTGEGVDPTQSRSSARIGWDGRGSMEQSGGHVDIGGDVSIGTGASGNGHYTISGGQLDVGVILAVGRLGKGTMNISGSDTVVTVGNYIGVATQPGSTGTLRVSENASVRGNSSVNVGGTFNSVGGSGDLTISTGGTLEARGALRIWEGGTVSLLGGRLTTPRFEHNRGGEFDFQGGVLRADVFSGELFQAGGVIEIAESYGLMTINGDLTQQGGTIEFEISGVDRGVT